MRATANPAQVETTKATMKRAKQKSEEVVSMMKASGMTEEQIKQQMMSMGMPPPS